MRNVDFLTFKVIFFSDIKAILRSMVTVLRVGKIENSVRLKFS
jgi:hypothetical protein